MRRMRRGEENGWDDWRRVWEEENDWEMRKKKEEYSM
jgi:hypothetical protein